MSIFIAFFSSHNFSLADSGAVGSAETNMAQNLVGQAVAVDFVVKNAKRCGKKRYWACVNAALGVAQLSQMVQQFGKAKDVRDNFATNPFTGFDQNSLGFCLPPATGCSQDALDKSLMGTQLGSALSSADSGQLNKAISAVKKLNMDTIKDLEAQGYSVDLENGTITGPDGKSQSLNGDMNLPSSMTSALNSRLDAIDKNITNGGAANRSLASTVDGGKGSASKTGGSADGAGAGGSTDLQFVDAFGESGASASSALKKREKTKQDLLAAMADKSQSGVVGMPGDNIFKMIQRRYDKKKKSAEFIVQQ